MNRRRFLEDASQFQNEGTGLVGKRGSAITHPASETQNRVRLCILTQFFPPDYAPTGQLIAELGQQLSKQGAQVEIFSGQPGYAFQASDSPCSEWAGEVLIRRSRTAQLWPQRIRGRALNGVMFCIRAGLHMLRARKERNVFLLTTAPPFLPIVGYIANLLLGTSYVCLLYDLYPEIAVQLGVISERHWLARLWRNLNRRVWERSDGIIVLSSAMKQRVVDCCPDAVGKTHVIHSWADPDQIFPVPKQKNWFAWKYNFAEKFTVLYSGNMGRVHDLDTFLEAILDLQHEPVQFVFIGSGPKRKEFMAKAEQLGLRNLTFLPYQSKQDLPYSLTACDLALVSISAGLEDLVAPSKLYSALSAGRPIAAVCPRHSYLTKLIADAGCGAVFENQDGQGLANFIRFLMNDAGLATRMGESGRRYLQNHFTPSLIAKQYLDILANPVSGRW
jgi:glycosyltransferase involved in cell wall biosynthesis